MIDISDFVTNCFRIENVEQISWCTYQIQAQNGFADLKSQSESFGILDSIRHDFTQHGHYAALDHALSAVWTFQTSSLQFENESQDFEESSSMLAQKHSLARIASGTIKAQDLETLQKRQFHPITPYFQHSRSVSSTIPNDVGGQDPVEMHLDRLSTLSITRHDVYEFFLSAILEKILHCLAFECSMIPLCYNTLAYDSDECYDDTFNDLLRNAQSRDHDNLSPGIHKLRSFTIGVNWLSDGNLFLSLWDNPVAYTQATIFDSRCTHSTEGDVIVAPIGLRLPCRRIVRNASISGEDPLKRAFKRDQREQWEVISLLQRRGILLHDPDDWSTCLLQESWSDKESSDARKSFQWPTELIFLALSTSSGDDAVSWVNPYSWQNPLQPSQSWGHNPLGGSVDGSMDEDETETPKAPISTDKDDMYAEILESLLSSQNTAALYPTPPEVSRSSAVLNREKPEFSAPTPATTASGPVWGTDDTELPSSVVEDDIIISLNDETGHDDLFGDLSMELIDNPLNDDEFDFFDAPNTTFSDKILQPQVDSSSPRLAEQELENSQPKREKNVSFEPVVQHSTWVEGTDVAAPSQEDQNRFVTAGKGFNVSPPRQIADDLGAVASPKRAIKEPLDEKYRKGGFFGVSTHTPSIGSGPKQNLQLRPAVPIITVSHQRRSTNESSPSTSSADESSDDSDSGSETGNDRDEAEGDSMEGVVGSLDGQFPDSPVYRSPNGWDLVIDLILSRISILPQAFIQKGDPTRRLSQYLNLDGHQYMELSRSVESQLRFWTSDGLATHQILDTPQPRNLRYQGQHTQIRHAAFSDNVLSPSSLSTKNKEFSLNDGLNSEERIKKTLVGLFTKLQRVDLLTCANVQNRNVVTKSGQNLSNALRYSKFPSGMQQEQAMQLKVPDIVVRREMALTIMSASALSLSVELGIGPAGGGREIVSYCFVPSPDIWAVGAATLLRLLSETWLTLKLGAHEPGVDAAQNKLDLPGIITVEPGDRFQSYFQNLCRNLSSFGQRLLESRSFQSTAVYIVNPSDDISAIPSFCAAFQRLQKLLQEKGATQRQFVLKIIPYDMVVQRKAFSVPLLRLLKPLAREMYDRCSQAERPFDHTSSLASLSRCMPKTVDFHLSQKLDRTPLGRDMVTHVAYSWSPGNPWLSFAYCDDIGEKRWNASYHVPWERGLHHPMGQARNQDQSDTISTPEMTTPRDHNLGVPQPATASKAPNQVSMAHRFFAVVRDMLANLVELSEDCMMPNDKHVHHVMLVKDGAMSRQEEHVWKLLTRRCAEPGGVASVLGSRIAGNSDSNDIHNDDTGGFKDSKGTTYRKHAHNIMVKFTIAILDVDCPVTLSVPRTRAGSDPEASLRGFNQSSGFHHSDLPASTPGTPSLASPGIFGASSSQGRDMEEQQTSNARLVSPGSLAWFVPAQSIIAQSYTGRLEIVPTPKLPIPLGGPSTSPLTHATTSSSTPISTDSSGNNSHAMSGGGYLILGGSDTGEDVNSLGKPSPVLTALSLRIITTGRESSVGGGSGLNSIEQLAQAYRGLATIADIYGLGGRLPWHVAVARRGRIRLRRCM